MSGSTDCIVTPLPLYAFLSVEGTRAVDFLQAQLSCDLREARPGRVLAGAWCNIKGRVVANLLLRIPEPGRVLLRLRADLASSTCAALNRYAALSRVKLVAEPGCACIGVLGSGARAHVEERLGAAPGERLAAADGAHDAFVVQRDSAGTVLEVWAPAAAADALLQELRGAATPGTAADWLHALVTAGLAEVQHDTRELFLPQMLGYDADGTVSFRKGCYPGQEVVARAHYKGAVKRHLVLLGTAGGDCPAPGAELFADARPCGNIVECAPARDGRLAALAVLSEDALAAGAVRTAQGLVLQPAPPTPVL
jgi:hypothetical protein